MNQSHIFHILIQYKALTIGILFLTATSFSQTGNEFEIFIRETFETNLNQMASGSLPTGVLKGFAANLIVDNTQIAIDGQITRKQMSKDEIRNLLTRLSMHSLLSVKWNITNFNQISVRNNTRMANFEADVNITLNNQTLTTGKNLVSVVAKKIADHKYVIVYLSIIQVVDENYYGKCFLEIEKNNNSYITRTSYPNGTFYETAKTEIEFIGTNKLKTIKVDGEADKLFWNQSMNIISKEQNGKQTIGQANSTIEAVKTVIKNKYWNKCRTIVISSVNE